MKASIGIALSLALSVALAGCGKQSEAPKADEKAAAAANDAGTMAMPAETKHGKGTATVTAIDTAKGQVTLDHSAIVELEWPPMTMGFAAKPDLLKDIKVGDKVAFELDWDGKAGTITKLDKAP
ncbi:Cu/Ag efflux protein CusF [Sphingopyxis italica]|jgi:Cu(I)/Ag(I) efflux system protein CusF|uniref:Copper ABC transporter substrate-binding protein n=2 Tax=Sphingopyxis TaxID=165697 RepID=A0AAC9AXY5_SPHMC|nr:MULTISPECIES: copper-binding protein [Sphingopyxis]ALJ15561.1 copper ABC transporter substrate-binding protein [Sphingopyxis macrogoltabida]AMU91802.1 copper ABC transporter substrate-binding protein [Sphingopyxis macrogoltabida]NJB90760.1 Cu/Ag efflux protein CusF [Sphingopyxis italica]